MHLFMILHSCSYKICLTNVHQEEADNREHISLFILFINTSFYVKIPNTLGLF